MSANKERGVRCKINEWDETMTCNRKADLDHYLYFTKLKILFTLCETHYTYVNNL
jgi:hypothetical protein